MRPYIKNFEGRYKYDIINKTFMKGAFSMKKILEIGQSKGCLVGNNDLVIQSAVDYLSYLGGGTVKIGAGVFEIGSSIHLRSNVNLEGVPGETVLKKCANVVSALATDGDANERQLTLKNPDGFEPGHTVTIRFEGRSLGFLETVAVITGKEGNVVSIDRGLIQDYCMQNGNAIAERNFPVISGYHCKNNRISGITIDGNKENNSLVGGCRNAGIFFFEAKNIAIEDCIVKMYNGDGISYQTCKNVIVKNTICSDNAGLGLHPGSGTTGTHISGCTAINNGGDGIFVCWRVTQGIIENCLMENNERNGLSIGHKDTHNIIRDNRIVRNKRNGILFRREIEPMGANYNLVENNDIIDNGSDEYAKDSNGPGYIGIRIYGCTHDVKFINNRISYETAGDTVGILVEQGAYDNIFEENAYTGCTRDLVIL